MWEGLAVRANKIMKSELVENIKSILEELGVKIPIVNFDTPTHIELGDCSTNVAMVYAKQLNKKPTELAEEIKNKLEDKKIEHLSKIDVVSPGFINFFFDRSYFGEVVKTVISEKESFGNNALLSGQKIIIEYTDPNPFKE